MYEIHSWKKFFEPSGSQRDRIISENRGSGDKERDEEKKSKE